MRYYPKSNVIFGNVNLSDYNAFAFYCNLFDKAERDMSVVSVPGRNGDLLFDNGRYKNVERVYRIQVTGLHNIQSLLNDLSAQVGYRQLKDEYESGVYMQARLKRPPQINQFVGDSVDITLTFDRMPQKYSDVQTVITTRSVNAKYGSMAWLVELSVNNPTAFEARPDIYIKPTKAASGGGPASDSNRANWVYIYKGDIREEYSEAEGSGSATTFYNEVEANPNTFMHIYWNLPNSSTAFTLKSEDRIIVPVSGLIEDTTPQAEINFSDGAPCDFPILTPGANTISIVFVHFGYSSYTDNPPQSVSMTVKWRTL